MSSNGTSTSFNPNQTLHKVSPQQLENIIRQQYHNYRALQGNKENVGNCSYLKKQVFLKGQSDFQNNIQNKELKFTNNEINAQLN
jgi:hypothetical protein